jgi:NADH dehydrogenase
MTQDHELVVVGGGVAGLDIASHLAGKRAGGRRLHVTLIDREKAYVWKPMLHTIAAGTSEASAQQTAYAAQARSRGFSYQPGEAIGIDRESRQVSIGPLRVGDEELVPARTVAYDTLVLAVGSRANDFGTPGVAENCISIDTRSEAIAFNDQLRILLVKAAVSGRPFTIGIVGAGATGVELAAQLVQIADIAEQYGLSGAAARLKVVLIESGSRVLGPFPDRVAHAAGQKLEQLGIEIRTGARVEAVDATGFRLAEGDVVAAELKVWAAGVKAPAFLDTLAGVDRSRSGQLVVGPTMALTNDPRIFAVGDCASPVLPGRDQPVPTTAQAAHQEALYLCQHLPALIAGGSAPAFKYHDFGSLVSLGGYDAYGSLGRFGFFDGGFIRGRVAQLGHALLYRSYQARVHGFWKGGLLWLADTIARRVRPSVRL